MQYPFQSQITDPKIEILRNAGEISVTSGEENMGCAARLKEALKEVAKQSNTSSVQELKNEIKFWTKKFCPECEKCPEFRDGLLLYKDLTTPYRIEFPNYEHMNKKSKEILIELFGNKEIPEPSRDREYFPYSVINNKIDMDSVIPTMA